MRPAAFVFLSFLLGGAAFAQPAKPTLKWGMDSTGGAPYIYDNNSKGFEVELAEYLAGELGRTSEPVNNKWDKLPDELNLGRLDIVLNGYEYAERYEKMASIPYYVYTLTLVVHADNNTINSWNDLRSGEGRPKVKVGVLEGSAAQRYLEKAFGDEVEIEVHEDVSNTYNLVGQKRLDATVQDNPAAHYFVPNDPGKRLKLLPETRAEGFYVILTRKDDRELRERINAALRKGIGDGTLERIYSKYGLWNKDQERLGHWSNKVWGNQPLAPEQTESAAPLIDWGLSAKLLLRAAGTTVLLAVCSMPLATLIGMVVAILRLYGPRWLGPLLTVYVEVLRGTPLLLQLYFLYYFLPDFVPLLKEVPKWYFGLLGLALNYSASQAEHFRGAFLNLPRGQYEAALCLGMPRWTAIRHVLAPQAFRAAVPSVTNDFVALFKDTAVCSVIAVMELTKQYNTLYNNHREHIVGLAAITACLYLMMSYPLALAARRLEHKAGGHR
jgi:polar amino acid transport system substrate-binding protein